MKFTSKITAFAAVTGLTLTGVPVSLQAQNTPTTTTAAAPAPATTATTAKPKKDKPKTTEYSGNVTAIDTMANTITVASSAKLLMLSLAPTTKIQKDKKMATIADFTVGDKVTGSYTVDATGKMTAHSLHKKSLTVASAAKPAKTAATSAANSATPAAAPVPAMAPGQ